jgi:tRNA1Val (adenine37-N6)-methyltransferase
MKVTTDACLFGAWVAKEVGSQQSTVDCVLDIGTGTGLLALMVAQKNDEVLIDSIEIEKDAADQANENAASSPWKERIAIINEDVKGFSFTHKYDLIISNPPFYENEIRSATDSKNVAHHSENLTLEELLLIIKSHLASRGSFFLLLPYKRNEEVKRVFKDHQLHISKILLVKQSVKHDYFRIMLKGKRNHKPGHETIIEEMSILDHQQRYSPEFLSLLKDYYLHL